MNVSNNDYFGVLVLAVRYVPAVPEVELVYCMAGPHPAGLVSRPSVVGLGFLTR